MHTKRCFCTFFFVMSLRKDFFARINFREIARNSRNLLPVKVTSFKIKWLKKVKLLKLQWCKFYNNKYMIASTQITKTEIFPFIWCHILWHNSWLCWRLNCFYAWVANISDLSRNSRNLKASWNIFLLFSTLLNHKSIKNIRQTSSWFENIVIFSIESTIEFTKPQTHPQSNSSYNEKRRWSWGWQIPRLEKFSLMKMDIYSSI